MPNKVRIIHKLIGGPSAHVSVDISLTLALTLEMTNQGYVFKSMHAVSTQLQELNALRF